MTWKHIAATAALIAMAVGVWMFKPAAPVATPVAPYDNTALVAADPEMLAFGLSRTPRDLTLRSRLSQDVHWAVRTGSRFEIAPESGTIEAFGRTTVRVQPRSASLTVGLNSEHTWLGWNDANGPTQQLLVRLTAIRAPDVEYNVVDGDELTLAFNSATAVRARATGGWRRLTDQQAWKAGDNQLDVRAGGSRRGAPYVLMLRVGSKEMAISEATDMPLTITLDPDLGFISLAAPAGRP